MDQEESRAHLDQSTGSNSDKDSDTEKLNTRIESESSDSTQINKNSIEVDASDANKDESKKIFLKELYDFMAKRGYPILRPPSLGFQELDLYKLYKEVTKRGGMDEVTAKQEWKLVYNALDIPTISTSASYNTRTNYKKYLYLYELEHFETEADKLAETMDFKFKRGEYVRIESTTQNQVYYAYIIKKRFINDAKMYYIHYNGWSTTHDEWMPEYALQHLLPHEQYTPSELRNPPATRSSKSNYLIEDPTLYPKRHPTGKASKKSKLSPAMNSSSGSVGSFVTGPRKMALYAGSQDEWYTSIGEEQLDENLFRFSGTSPTIKFKLPQTEQTIPGLKRERYGIIRYIPHATDGFSEHLITESGLQIFSEDMNTSISTLITASEYGESEYSDADMRMGIQYSRGVCTRSSDAMSPQTLSSIQRINSQKDKEVSNMDQRRQRTVQQSVGYFFRDDQEMDLSKDRERVERERFDQLPLKPDFPPITASNLHALAVITTESETETEYANDSDYSESLNQLRAESQAILNRAKLDDSMSWKDIIKSDLKANISSKSLVHMSPDISTTNGTNQGSNVPSDSVKTFTTLQESFQSTLESISKRMREIRKEIENHKEYLKIDTQTSHSEEDNDEMMHIQMTPETIHSGIIDDPIQLDTLRPRRKNVEKYKR